MYIYCLNNPVNNCDPTGEVTISAVVLGFIITAFASQAVPEETKHTASQAISDGITTIGEGIAHLGKLIGTAKQSVAPSKSITTATTQRVVPKTVIFPVNPAEFTPRGCIPTTYPGTSNGRVIDWTSGGTVVFRWDEDLKNGSHYHVMPIKGGDNFHYWPLMPVPYPFNKIFF